MPNCNESAKCTVTPIEPCPCCSGEPVAYSVTISAVPDTWTCCLAMHYADDGTIFYPRAGADALGDACVEALEAVWGR